MFFNMCGRFTLKTSRQVLAEWFKLDSFPELRPRYNVAPTQDVPVVRASADGGREVALLRWGLVPSWADDPGIGNRLINARAEGVDTKPSFRTAFKQRRCLVVADGFYEWQPRKGKKQPWLFQVRGEPFAFAGLWERWQHGGEDPVESCTLITTEANDLVKPVHNRMPVILPSSVYNLWLDPEVKSADTLLPLLKPFEASLMTAVPVSTRVNNPKFDDPSCVAEVSLA
jgi:putative SOS response-associated peptidase YedK